MLLRNLKQIQNSIDTIFPLPQETSALNKQTTSSMELLRKPPYMAQNFISITDSIHILKSAITEYTNLTYFHFVNYGEYGQTYNIKFGTKLQDLEERYCPYQSMFHDPPLIDSKRSSTQKMTYALIESSRFKMLDLNVIYDIMFDVKYLKLLECQLEKGVERVMDFRRMESLRTLVLDIGFLRYQFQFGVVISIEFEKDKLVRWYKWFTKDKLFIQFETLNQGSFQVGLEKLQKKKKLKRFL